MTHAYAIFFEVSFLKFISIWIQEHHFSSLQRETEKLHADIEKMHSELRFDPHLSHVPFNFEITINLATTDKAKLHCSAAGMRLTKSLRANAWI